MRLGVDTPTPIWLDVCMTNNTNTTNALTDLINGMIAERRQFAADNGFVATDQEIADHIKASLIRMMSEAK